MPPNILFIIVDDLNAWIGALGRHPQVRTPHIDALARRGVLFTHAYCSAPYCNASRMGLFTGRLPSSLGVYHNEPFWDQAQRPHTFIERLKAHGYHTFGAGKVFHGVFDYATAGRESSQSAVWREIENRDELWSDFASNTSEPLPAHRPQNGLFDFSNFDSVPEMYHLFDWGPLPDNLEGDLPDTRVTNSVAGFLAKPVEPFFCAAGLYKPHLPWHAPKRFFDLYDRDTVHVPLVKDDDLDDVPPIARAWALTPPDHELITSRGVWPDAVQAYLACISYADHLIGKIVAALDASSARNRTAIVLCGDNGFHLGEKLHWRKFALWEEATRVPLIYVPPGARELEKRVIEPVSLIDIAPTLLELAGLDADPQSDALSLLPYVADTERRRERPVITSWQQDNHSLRDRRWRFTRYADGGEELYDHAVDSYEWTNLAGLRPYRHACEALAVQIDAHCSDKPA